MTNKQIKIEEKHLSEQSGILNDSLDFWQCKALEQITFCKRLDREAEEGFDGPSEAILADAQQELNYFMMKLAWENKELNSLDNRIKIFLKNKKSK